MKDVTGSRLTFYFSRSVALFCALSCGFWGMTGCGSSGGASVGGGGTSGPTPLVAGGASDVFVIQYNSDAGDTSILDFAAGSSGSVAPKSTLVVGSGFVVNSVANDSAGQIYVGGYTPSTDTTFGANYVYVFAAGATGMAAPLQSLQTAVQPWAMTVDSAGSIYLANDGVIEKIMTNNTAIFLNTQSFLFSTGIAVDKAGNIYVSVFQPTQTSLGGSIQVFAASQGPVMSVTPLRTITTNGIPYGVALDQNGNIYATVDVQTNSGGPYLTSSASVVQYAGGTTGSATPLKTISASVFTDVSGVQVDAAGNLYLLNTITNGTGSSATLTPELLGFAGSVAGSASPAVTLSSSAWNNPGDNLGVH